MFDTLVDTSFVHTLVHVQIDYSAMLIKRTFNNALPCVSGEINPRNKTSAEVTQMFTNEVNWLIQLNGSKYIPELISYDFISQTIIQKYYEPSCLLTGKIPSVNEVLELYCFFKSNQLLKINGSLSNMSYNANQLIAFDFKHAISNTYISAIEYEYYSYDTYLSKIDSTLPSLLRSILHE